MNISLSRLRSLLEAPPDGHAIEQALIHAGFPIESREELPNGDVRLDVEITSNRGDCLSHVGLAREAAAALAIPLRRPLPTELPSQGPPVAGALTLRNEVPEVCPRFTTRVIRGARVAPSPAWLRDALEAVGQRSINAVVDVTNYITGELGNPCHVFDLAKLAGGTLIVRYAIAGERLTTLDGKARTLAPDELVVADAQRPQSLAGVMGGHDSEVGPETTDLVIEMATWDPIAVRRAARRHQLRTDASHRFERFVDARTIDEAAARCAALILSVAGGTLCEGMLDQGLPRPAPTRVRFRPSRCRALLGVSPTTDEMVGALGRLEISCEPIGRGGEEIGCTIPPHRPDLTREADLIEEVARINGLARIPVHDTLPVSLRPPQASEKARREIAGVLTGLGFYETISFSFTTPGSAREFCPTELTPIEIGDDRRGEEPALRPSVLCGLLACRRKNQHGLVRAGGGIRLFEVAAVFAQHGDRTLEHLNVGLLLDVPVSGRSASATELQHGVRLMRGAIEQLVLAMAGPHAGLVVTPSRPYAPAFDDRVFARVSLGDRPLGYMGLVGGAAQRSYDLATPVVGAELNLASLIAGFPPVGVVHSLPAFPGIERDLSVVVAEGVEWAAIERTVRTHAGAPFEDVSFVSTYRGQQLGKGRKSVTLRLSFRDPARTLRHEEVDAPTQSLVQVLKREHGAELRA